MFVRVLCLVCNMLAMQYRDYRDVCTCEHIREHIAAQLIDIYCKHVSGGNNDGKT